MTSTLPDKQKVLDIGISKTSYEEIVDFCMIWAREKKIAKVDAARYICVTSVHGVMTARRDPELATILNSATAATPDGMPLVWALRSFGSRNQQRVYGPTLMLEICKAAAVSGAKIFLYGGRDSTLQVLQNKLLALCPNLTIAGAYAPPFRALTAAEDQQVQAMIRDSDADIVFVGISTPKQEKWMYAHRDCFPGVTLLGVGAAFDFHCGRVKQAPSWMQRNGLEWLFRLLMEPARLWKRYLLVTPVFIPLWALQRLGLRFRRLST